MLIPTPLCAMQMKLPETKIKPLAFVDNLGKPEKIYSTTFASFLFPIFLFGIVFLIGLVPLTINIYNGTTELDDDVLKIFVISLLLFVFAIYLFIGNGYRYVALFKNGVVLKKRFRIYEIKYREIEKVELRSWGDAIDILLRDGSFVSMGESERLIDVFHYPRLFKGVRIVKIKQLFGDLDKKVNALAHNNGYKQ